MANEETLGLVTKRLKHAEAERQKYDDKWDKLYDMFRFKMTIKEGRANLFIPYAFSNVETVFPRMVAKRPRVQVLPKGPSDVEPATVMKTLIDYAWAELGIDEIVRRWVKGCLIYGTGIVKVTWDKVIEKVGQEVAVFDEEGNPTGTEVKYEKKVTYDAPRVANKDLRSVYCDPDGVTIEDCRYVIDKYMAIDTELAANPNYDKKLLKNVVYGYTNDEIRRGLHNSSRPSLPNANECEVLEYWENDRLIVVAGGQILRDGPNPYHHKKKPFVLIVDQIDDQILYGIGEVEPIQTLQSEFNTIRGQRMDYNNIVLNPTWNVRAGAVEDINSIKFVPGWKNIINGDLNGIQPMNMPNVPQSSYHEEESIKSDFMTVTGVSDYAKGNEGANLNDTATGISLIQEAANQRFNAKLQNLETGLMKLAEFLRDLYLQFAPDELVLRLTEKDGFSFQTVTPEDIRGEFDILIEAGSTVPSNKIQDRTEEMNKYNILTANPLVNQTAPALLEVTRALLEKWEDPNSQRIMDALTAKVQEIQQVQEIEKSQVQAGLEENPDDDVATAMEGPEGMMPEEGMPMDEAGMGPLKASGPAESPEAEAIMRALAEQQMQGGE